MRVAAISYGTEGDVRPMLALAAALREGGHRFLLAGDEACEPLARVHDVDYLPLSGDLKRRMREGDEVADFVRGGASPLAGLGVLRRIYQRELDSWTRDFTAAATGSDVLISSGLSLPVGFNTGERLGIPVVAAFFQPLEPEWGQRSSALPVSVPASLHRPLLGLARSIGWGATWRELEASRRVIGLGRRWIAWRRYPKLGAWSPTLAPGRDVTGAWWTPAPIDFTPPADLTDFLAAGPAPLLVGFGSMAVPSDTVLRVVETMEGRRVLLQSGWGAEIPESLPSTVHVLGHVPHAWLLPKVTGAVHHCGAGTSHAMVRAGVPSIPMPVSVDQPFWASRLHGLGLATRPLNPRRVDAAHLRRSLSELDALRPNLDRAAMAMASEDGPQVAVARLEALLR